MNALCKVIGLAIMLLPMVVAAQTRRSFGQPPPAKCVQPLSSGDSAVTATIQKYLKNVAAYEIPVVAIQHTGDTTHYIVSAFMATYSVKKNPPTQIVKFAGREALLYTGKRSIAQTAPACFQALLKKYSRILHIDKLNRRDGIAPDKDHGGYAYDPILKDIAVAKDGHITVKSLDRFPYIRYD